MKTKDLISEAMALPIEERVQLADSILKSLNQPEENIDKLWKETAKKRLAELRSGAIKAVDGNEVFNKIWERYK